MNKILSSASSCELLIENDFFNDLGEIMEDPKYKTFFDKYFSTSIDIKSTLFYMQLYRQIKIKYKEKKGIDLDKMTNLAMINYIMNVPELRKTVMTAITENYNEASKIKKVISDTNLLTNK